MKRAAVVLAAASAMLLGCAAQAPPPSPTAAREQVFAVERAFARTMADRDHRAFVSFLSDEAVFLMGGKPLRGKNAVADYWKRFYIAPKAPFSWKPDRVQVLDSGGLGYSTGPVFDEEGKQFARFYSTWRREPDGAWHIVFDDGCNLGCK